MLWVSATGGFGKSVLAAYLTEALKERFKDSPVTFFFCKEKEELCEVHQIVRTLLYQLSSFSNAINQHIRAIWDNDEDIADLASGYRDFYYELLFPALQTFQTASQNPIFIIFDGLNELPKSRLVEVLDLIRALQHPPSDLRLRIVVMSQPTKTITSALKSAVPLSLTSSENLDNVETYVKSCLNETLKDLFNELGVDPVDYFREKCLGMFLWVKAILELIAPIDVNTDLQKILNDPPRSIEAMYQKVLERLYADLNEIELPWIQEIICWTVMSKRDLTLAEIEVAILLSREEHGKATRARFINIGATLSKCATILRVSDDPSTKLKTVSVLHDSFKQFITNGGQRGPTGIARSFRVVKPEADYKIVAACISYLCREAIEIEEAIIIPDMRRKRLNEEYPMFSYASMFWEKHITSEGGESVQKKLLLVLTKLFLRENLRNWISSVMGYTYNGYMGALYDPVSLSVPGSLENAITWINQSPDAAAELTLALSKCYPSTWSAVTDSQQPDQTSVTILKRWCAAIMSEVWKISNPRHWEVSFQCFESARALCISQEEIVARKISFETLVNMIAGLADSSCRKNQFKWFANQSNIYLRNGGLESQVLAESALQLALDYAPEVQKPIILSSLSDCFRNVHHCTESKEYLDKSVAYAESAVDASDINRFHDYLYLRKALASKLFYRSMVTSGTSIKSSEEDSRRAVKLNMQALRLILTYDNMSELNSPTLHSPEDNEWKLLPLPQLSADQDNEVTLPPDIFDILQSFSFGLSIHPSAVARIDDLKELIDSCKRVLPLMTEQNPLFWDTLGNVLLSCHLASRSLPKSKLDDPVVEDTLSAHLSTEQIPAVETDTLSTSVAQLSISDNELRESIYYYRGAVSLTPDDHPDWAMYTYHLGLALLEIEGCGNHLDEAIECFRKITDIDSSEDQITFLEYLFQLGLSLRRRDGSATDTTEAIKCFERIIELAPARYIGLPFAADELGQIYNDVESLADVAKSIEYRRVALKHLPQSHSAFPRIANELGNIYYSQLNRSDDFTNALEAYQLAIDSSKDIDIDYAIYLTNAGYAFYHRRNEGDLSNAIDMFKSAIRLAKSDEDDILRSEYGLGLALWRRALDGDFDEAIIHIRETIRLGANSPQYNDYYNLLGLVLRARRRPEDVDESITCHRRAIELTAESHEAIHVFEHNLGVALSTRNSEADIKEAIEHYHKALDLSQKHEAKSLTLSLYMHSLGDGYYAVNEDIPNCLETAIGWYRKAIELRSDDPFALASSLTALGAALASMGETLEASECLRDAITLTPDNHKILPFRYQRLAQYLRATIYIDCEYTVDLSWLPDVILREQQWRMVSLIRTFFPRPKDLDISVPLQRINEAILTVRRAIELSRQLEMGEQLVHSQAILTDCLFQRYTLTQSVDDLDEANTLMWTIFRSEWRKDIDARLGDLVKFGALCFKWYSVDSDLRVADMIALRDMANEVPNIEDGVSMRELFKEMIVYMGTMAEFLLMFHE